MTDDKFNLWRKDDDKSREERWINLLPFLLISRQIFNFHVVRSFIHDKPFLCFSSEFTLHCSELIDRENQVSEREKELLLK